MKVLELTRTEEGHDGKELKLCINPMPGIQFGDAAASGSRCSWVQNPGGEEWFVTQTVAVIKKRLAAL